MTKTNIFMAFLVSVLVVGPAFSDEVATQNWVKSWIPGWAENKGSSYFIPVNKESNFFPQRRGEVLSSGTAHQMRDLLYRHKEDSLFVPDSSMVKEGYELRTTGQTAFEGINEVLEKVDGNNGTPGSSVQLETVSQNAFGAVNELKGKVDELQEDVDGLSAEISDKVSNDELTEGYYTKSEVDEKIEGSIGPDSKTIYDLATGRRKYVSIVDRFNESIFNE